MTEINGFTLVMQERRWNAAWDLIRAQDSIALLGKVSLAGGGIGITPADTDRLRTAQQRWESYR
jgi:hypothetical protein